MSRSTEAALSVGETRIGAGAPCFIIAEAGVNHNGDPALAHQLVDVAAECGANAVKFQTFVPEALVARGGRAAPYQQEAGATDQRSMLERLSLPATVWPELAAHARERGLTFLSTAFDTTSLSTLLTTGVEAIKVPSGELDNLEFIAELASHGLPLIISTGLGTLDEVEAAVDAATAAPGIALLHCVTAYPAPVESSNLRAMTTMLERFRVPVGWSDHTEGHVTAVVAIALGASILEKHVTLDRDLPGPDHGASAEPQELAAYVAAVRAASASLGDGVKRPAEAELENRASARRSYHATRELQPGDTVVDDDVELLRPATGISPSVQVIGRTVARRVRAGQALRHEDLR